MCRPKRENRSSATRLERRGDTKLYAEIRDYKKSHSPVPQSEEPKYPDRPRFREGGGRRNKTENITKNRLCCATNEWPEYPDHSPALSRVCRQEKIRMNHPKLGPKAQKMCQVPQ